MLLTSEDAEYAQAERLFLAARLSTIVENACEAKSLVLEHNQDDWISYRKSFSGATTTDRREGDKEFADNVAQR